MPSHRRVIRIVMIGFRAGRRQGDQEPALRPLWPDTHRNALDASSVPSGPGPSCPAAQAVAIRATALRAGQAAGKTGWPCAHRIVGKSHNSAWPGFRCSTPNSVVRIPVTEQRSKSLTGLLPKNPAINLRASWLESRPPRGKRLAMIQGPSQVERFNPNCAKKSSR